MGQGDKVFVMHVPYASLDSSTCKFRSNENFYLFTTLERTKRTLLLC